MFRLHDGTRRQVCLCGFLLLCVVPTVSVACWCVRRHLPGHVRGEARRLSRLLGLDVSLDGLKHLRPGAVLYEGLQLSDPETGRVALRCRLLEAGWAAPEENQGPPRPLLVLIASQPEVEAAEIGPLAQLVRRTLQRQPGPAEADIRVVCGELTLRSEGGSQTLSQLHGGLRCSPVGTQLQLSFRLAGVETFEPIRIRIDRNRRTTPPRTGFELDTGGGEVPCRVLAIGLPSLTVLGPRSRFRGCIWASEVRGDQAARRPVAAAWSGEMTGKLLDVDLGSLVSDRFPHKLSGTAQLTIQAARFCDARLQSASGTLVAGSGVIGRSLMDAAIEQLRLVPGQEPKTPGDLVPYDQLALAFLLDSEGLELQGRCAWPGSRAILVDRHSLLLCEPVEQPRPVLALVRTLVPLSEVQVPATRQTDWLLRHLPLPQIVPPQGSMAEAPRGRLRLGRAVRQ